ncbi:hypothetical protein EJA70_11730 [Pseudomonas sp. PB103]|nr:hypothetical protein EJA70_11730 [Pseudomonas sp. PB103]
MGISSGCFSYGYCSGVFEAAIAGKPAPTGFLVEHSICVRLDPCGSWLASDEGLTYTADFTTEGCARITHNP